MLPSLSTSRRLRLTAFTSFYVAQGLPMGLITVALPAWLASNGVSAEDVGSFVALAMLPWGFKLLAGPLMDRFHVPALGYRRPWVMLAQSGLLLALAALGIAAPSVTELWLLSICCFAVSSFAAVQDVAVDGMAIEILPEEERGRANALMAFGQVSGISVSGAASGWLLANLGVAFTAMFLAVCIALILAIVVLYRERDGEKLLPWTAGSPQHPRHKEAISWIAIGSNLIRVLVLPTSLVLLAVTVFWRIGHGMFLAAAPVWMTQELGWNNVGASNWISISGFVGAVAGIAIGPYIDRHGSHVFLKAGLVFGAVVFLFLWLTTPWWDNRLLWLGTLFLAKFAIQVVFVAFIALHMSICWSKVAATQFAIYMAWANLAYSLGAKVFGELSVVLEIGHVALAMAVFFVISLAIMPFVRLERHRERLMHLRAREPVDDILVDIPAGQ